MEKSFYYKINYNGLTLDSFTNRSVTSPDISFLTKEESFAFGLMVYVSSVDKENRFNR